MGWNILDWLTSIDELLKEELDLKRDTNAKLDMLVSLLSGVPPGEIPEIPSPIYSIDNTEFLFREEMVTIADGATKKVIEFDVPGNSVLYLQSLCQTKLVVDMEYILYLDSIDIKLIGDVFGTFDIPFDLTANGQRRGVKLDTRLLLEATNNTGAPVNISGRIMGEVRYVGG